MTQNLARLFGSVSVDGKLADMEISLSHEGTKASRAVGVPTSTPCMDLVCKTSMVLHTNQAAPVPAGAMGLPVAGIFWPHDAAFGAEPEPGWYTVTKSSTNPQRLRADLYGVCSCIYGGTQPGEVFARKKQANTVGCIEKGKQHPMNLCREAHKQRCVIIRCRATCSVQNLSLS